MPCRAWCSPRRWRPRDEDSDDDDRDGDADGGDEADADTDADADADVTPEAPPLAIATETLPRGRVQLDYSARLEAVNAVGDTRWEVSSGALPPGLTLAADGSIAGLPERSGSWEFEVTVHDEAGFYAADLAIGVPKVLLMSGFEPFDRYEINSSYEALKPFDQQIVEGLDVRIAELAVVWGDSWDELAGEIERLHPDVVISTGQAGPDGMRFETTAQNAMHGTDSNGVTMRGEPAVEGGPEALTAALPIDEMRAAMDAGGFPTLISDNAGAFLCNYVMYRLLYFFENATDGPEAAGFIHVPPVPSMGGLSVRDITAAHRLGIAALAAWLESDRQSRPFTADHHAAPVYFQ